MTHTAPLLIVRVATLPFESLERLAESAAREAAVTLIEAVESRAARAEALSAALYGAAGATASPERAGARGALLGVRRAIHQDRAVEPAALELTGPLLPAEIRDQIRRHLEEARSIEALRRAFERAFSEGGERERAALLDESRRPIVALGLRLVSRSLPLRAAGLARASRWEHRERHAASKILAYLGRFATKTSPNGVFCSTGLGTLDAGPAALRGENRLERLDFTLHVGEARKVAAVLAVTSDAASAVCPRVNPTLRRSGEAWTLWRPASPRHAEDEEVRLEIKDHPVMRMFLEAADGRTAAARVIETVTARVGQDTGPFFAKLVERGVLIAEVEIPWSERRPLRAIASRCPDAPWAPAAEAVERAVDALAQAPLEEIPARMDAVVSGLEALPRVRPLAADDAVRCDAATGLEARLPRALLGDLEGLLPRYARMYGAFYPEALTRETFAARFLKRYPADTPVPLLDLYHGVFEPVGSAPLAAFASAASGASDSRLRAAAGRAFERALEFFARRAREAEAAGSEEVILTAEDWDAIAGDAPEPRFSCAALFQVSAASVLDVASPQARVCLNALFPGAGLSVARLAHLHRPRQSGSENRIVRALEEGWARRARPNAAFAEVTFMHGGRTANAGLRPPLFALEIELPGERVSEGREAIPLADLTAAWDSAAGRFRLRSISRDLEIDPVIASGINPEGFVSFLTMAGSQGIQPLGLLPGFDADDVRRWPRFRFGNVVLFRRRWVVPERELPAGKTPGERFLDTQRWRRREGLPAHVFVHTDREPKPFYVNLDSPAFVDRFHRSVAAGASRVHVTEMLPAPGDLWVKDSRGRYASEFLAHCDNLGTAADARARR